MAQISDKDSRQQVEALWDRAEAARKTFDRQGALDAYWALLEHPCAHHRVTDYEVLDEIHRVLSELDRFDEAIEAKREAIAAGCRSSPDPEADIAEILVKAGRRAQADALYAELRERDPDDVWLYNSAGWIYRGSDDPEALRWLLDGIEVAIRTGDYDQVIGQLLDMATETWDRLTEPHDGELVARVEAFQRDWVRPPFQPARSVSGPHAEPEARRCGHCGFDPDRPPLAARTPGRTTRSDAPAKVELSLAWFRADEWAAAVNRWPDLLDELPEDHRAYTGRIEARLKWLTRHMPGQPLKVAPLAVEELVATQGDEAGTGKGRSRLAAEMARTGRVIAWPPGRNDPCWCGSGRKYKKCCGPVSPAEDNSP